MSLVNWPRRRGERSRVVYPEPEGDIRPPFKLPPDLERQLSEALDEPFGTPARTAQTVADELAHLRDELANARELLKQGEAKEAALQLELKIKIDEEIAAKKAAHDTEVAELESLRPSTGDTA
jgi:hypothetical protein